MKILCLKLAQYNDYLISTVDSHQAISSYSADEYAPSVLSAFYRLTSMMNWAADELGFC